MADDDNDPDLFFEGCDFPDERLTIKALTGNDVSWYLNEEAALKMILAENDCQIIQAEETESAVMDALAETLEAQGWYVQADASNLSESRYVDASRDGDRLKIRLSNHALPPAYAYQSTELTHDFRSIEQVKGFIAGLN